MKKSEVYNLAQQAVIEWKVIGSVRKMEILRVLMKDEDLALWSETQKENNDGEL